MKNIKDRDVRKTLEKIQAEIDVRNKELAQLNGTRDTLLELFGEETTDEAEETPEPVQTPERSRKPKAPRQAKGKPAPEGQGTEARLEDKPDTLAGAMKLLARKAAKPFTIANMFEALKADAGFAKLLADGAPNRVYGNLSYWAKTGKLTKQGDGDAALYTVVNL